MGKALFELRLVGGYRVWWSTITPTVAGRLHVINAPEFVQSAAAPPMVTDGTTGIWDLWPIDNPARPHPLREADQLTRPINLTPRTTGVALISLLDRDDGGQCGLWVELFLSQTEPAHNGRTLCEDWTHILRTTKDDQRQEVILRLSIGNLADEEMGLFHSKKKLVTSEMELTVRQR